MKREDLTFQTGFRVSVGNNRSQGAVMVLAKAGCEGGPDNRHKGADQWLVVLSGSGVAHGSTLSYDVSDWRRRCKRIEQGSPAWCLVERDGTSPEQD